MSASTQSYPRHLGRAILRRLFDRSHTECGPHFATATLTRRDRREEAEFSAKEARAIVGDLFRPNPAIYWADLLITVAVAYGFAIVYFSQPAISVLQITALLISSFALFRAGTFMHEIQHFSAGTMRPFIVGWNIICGIPMLMPSFFYDNHAGHHSRNSYGTHHDGEYLPLGAGPWSNFVVYVAQALLLPILVAIRFLVLTPISFLHPTLRRVILERCSYYGINPHYRRTLAAGGLNKWWTILEIACFACATGFVIGISIGLLPLMHIPRLYFLAAISLGLNYVRNLAAHRYRNDGGQMTYQEQLLDSINLTGHPVLTEFLFPLGLRYHALHHLFPTLPYHNMGKAHRRLMAELPADSAYRQTVHTSFLGVVRQLWNDAREGRRRSRHAPVAKVQQGTA